MSTGLVHGSVFFYSNLIGFRMDRQVNALTPRQRAIVEHIRDTGRGLVDDLAAAFGTTPQTIRKDLAALAEARLVERFHGGATLAAGMAYPRYEVREQTAVAQKAAIGVTAAGLIDDNVTIMVNGGSTTAAAADALRDRVGLRVVTDSVHIADRMRRFQGIEVMVPGGAVRASDGAIIGDTAVAFVGQFFADVALIGAAAISETGDLLDFDLREAGVARAIIDNARRVILAADRSKLGGSAPVRIGHLRDVDVFVTDRGADDRLRALCATCGADLVEADTTTMSP